MARRFNALDGVDEELRKLTTLTVQIRTGLAVVVRRTTEAVANLTRARAPFRTGVYRAAVLTTYFDDGLTGAVFIGSQNDQRGRRAKNLPIWLEYSTRKAQAQPHLTPTAAAAASGFAADTLRVVTAAVKAAE